MPRISGMRCSVHESDVLRKCDRSRPYVGVRWMGSERNICTVQELKPEKIIQNQTCDH